MPQQRTTPLIEGVKPEGRLQSTGTRWCFEQSRDEWYFRRSWFADFQRRWQHDLRNARRQVYLIGGVS